MDKKSDEEVSIFVRDEKTGRLVFNARALKVLGLNSTHVQQRGYPVKQPAVLTDAGASKLKQDA